MDLDDDATVSGDVYVEGVADGGDGGEFVVDEHTTVAGGLIVGGLDGGRDRIDGDEGAVDSEFIVDGTGW